jgi:hypothetical protein
MKIHHVSTSGMNYQQRNRALSECIRARCEKTARGHKAVCRHAVKLSATALLNSWPLLFRYAPLCLSLRDGVADDSCRVQTKKLLPSNNYIEFIALFAVIQQRQDSYDARFEWHSLCSRFLFGLSAINRIGRIFSAFNAKISKDFGNFADKNSGFKRWFFLSWNLLLPGCKSSNKYNRMF